MRHDKCDAYTAKETLKYRGAGRRALEREENQRGTRDKGKSKNTLSKNLSFSRMRRREEPM